ncbi:MAG: hypothetical protein AB2L09_04390 [Coriobacteriia bacterium]
MSKRASVLLERKRQRAGSADGRLALVGVAAVCVYLLAIVVTRQPIVATLAVCGATALVLLAYRPKALVYVLVVYSLLVKFLVDDLGFPGMANYLCDALLLEALVFAVTRGHKAKLCSPGFSRLGLAVGMFWFVATLTAVANGVAPVLYVWAVRNTLRLFGIVYCAVRLLDRDDVYRMVKIIVTFFVLNLAVCTFQHFVLGTGQDNTNGLFGTGSGGNAATNLCMLAVSAFSLFAYASRRVSLWVPVAALASCCYIASIAEIKVYFVELILLVALFALMEKPTLKTFAVVALGVAAFAAGVSLLTYLYPSFAGYFDLERIIESSYEGGYSNAYNLNRLTAVPILDGMFMNSPAAQLFGLGFGAGQHTQFFSSPLYSVWGELLNWTWFTDAAIFLETGYVGLALYVCAIVVMAVHAWRTATGTGADTWVTRSSAAVGVLCLLLVVYNCTLTVDPGCYFAGILLSFPYVLTKVDDGGARWAARSRSLSLGAGRSRRGAPVRREGGVL